MWREERVAPGGEERKRGILGEGQRDQHHGEQKTVEEGSQWKVRRTWEEVLANQENLRHYYC